MIKIKRNIAQMKFGRVSNPSAIVAAIAVAGFLAGCGQQEPPLQGERLDLRAPLTGLATDTQTGDPLNRTAPKSVPINLAPAVNHNEWTHRNGTAERRISHPALSANLTPLWSASIGSGDSRRHRITADPVVSGGRIFTLDAKAGVMAHSTGGTAIWSRDLTPASDRSGEASGGGIAIAQNTVFVTTGFGKLVALDAATGAEIWVQRLQSAATGAPTVRDGLVYVTSRDSRAWAIDAKNGRIKWQLQGARTPSGMVGGTSPAVSDKFAIFPFGSGEMMATFRKGGVRIWSTIISGKRRGHAHATISDITSDPVIYNNVVYAGSQSGRLVAVDLNSGERIWTAKEGAYSPVWPAGGSVFFVSDQANLVRLNAATGQHIWNIQLPYFTKDKPRRHKEVVRHYGPVLAGSRLVVPSGDGLIRSFNPVDGALISTLEIPGGASTNPVIVNGVLYVVSSRGQLHAFR